MKEPLGLGFDKEKFNESIVHQIKLEKRKYPFK